MTTHRITRFLALAGLGATCALALPAAAGGPAAGVAANASAPELAPITTGSTYDRNPIAVVDRNTTWLLFARSQLDCNRLQGCDADNSNYDLYAKQSTDQGKSWSAPELVAANPAPIDPYFRGRTIAVTQTKPGTFFVFWASGGSGDTLYWLSHTDKGGWSTLNSQPGQYFNVTAATVGKNVFVYSENAATGGIDEQSFDPATGFSAPNHIGPGSIPKVIVDKRGVVRMATVDGGTGTVSVASSSDGWTWSAPTAVAVPHDAVTNWDPSLVQLSDGTYVLLYAPDHGDGNQSIAARVSDDFQTWSDEITLTSPQGWWDYWPTAVPAKSGVLAFVTSEAPVDGQPAGTGHIWAAAVKR